MINMAMAEVINTSMYPNVWGMRDKFGWLKELSANPQLELLLNEVTTHSDLDRYPDLEKIIQYICEATNTDNPEWDWHHSHINYVLSTLSAVTRMEHVNSKLDKGETILHWVCRKPWDILNDRLVPLLVLLDADVNTADDLCVTPLHIACANKSDGNIVTLLKSGASLAARDIYGATPLQYAESHGYIVDKNLFDAAKFDNYNGFSGQLERLPELEDADLCESEEIMSWMMQYIPDENKCNDILLSLHDDCLPKRQEEEEMSRQVLCLFSVLSDGMKERDPRLAFTAHMAGSMVEGTKCKTSDFDLILDIPSFRDLCYPNEDDNYPAGYACMKQKENNGDQMKYSEFFTGRLLNMNNVLKIFIPLLEDVYYSISTWDHKSIPNLYPDLFELNSVGAIDAVQVWWYGRYNKALHISIDVVPAIFIKDWWPKNAPLMNSYGQAVTKQVSVIMKQAPEFMLQENNITNMAGLLFSVSQHHEEIEVIRAAPAKVKLAYKLAKSLVGHLPYINGERDLLTYMLKTALMHVLRHASQSNDSSLASIVSQFPNLEAPWFSPSTEHKDLDQEDFQCIMSWASSLFNHILGAAESGCLPEYFQPKRNILVKVLRYPDGFEKDNFYPVLATMKIHCLMALCLLSISRSVWNDKLKQLESHVKSILG